MTPDEMMKEGDKLYNQGSPGGAREWYVGAFAKLGIIAGNQLEALEKRNAELSAEVERRHGIGGELIAARRERDEALAELERVTAQVPRWVRVEDFKADESKLQFAWMAHKGRAYITMVKPHPELDGFAIVTHEADYTDMPDGYIALIAAPLTASSGPSETSNLLAKAESALRTIVASGEATDFQISIFNELKRHIDGASSGPEQPKCPACNGAKMILVFDPLTGDYKGTKFCPDCAKDRDEDAEAHAHMLKDDEAGMVARLVGRNGAKDRAEPKCKLCPAHCIAGVLVSFGGAELDMYTTKCGCPCHSPAPAAKEANHD